MEAKFKDTDDVRKGPNEKRCENGGLAVDDEDKRFDGVFKCDCRGTFFAGDNCEVNLKNGCPEGEALDTLTSACRPFSPHFNNTRVSTDTGGGALWNPAKQRIVGVGEALRIAPYALYYQRSNFSSSAGNDPKNNSVVYVISPAPGARPRRWRRAAAWSRWRA